MGAGEVDLPALVERLATATGVPVARPAGDVALPVVGLAGNLSRKMLSDVLGVDATVAVEGNALVVTVARAVLAPGAGKHGPNGCATSPRGAEREARRRLRYGLHALKSYRPNDPSRPTICLIHGVNSSSAGFRHLVPPLQDAGFGVVVYDYQFNRGLDESCRRFARDWAAFRRETGDTRPWRSSATRWAVSSRDYVEGPSYAGDVSDLVMIAPVNQGSHLARTQTLLQLMNGLQAVGDRRSTDTLAHLGDGLARRRPICCRTVNSSRSATRAALRGCGLSHRRGRRRSDSRIDGAGRSKRRPRCARNRGGLLGGLARMAGGTPEELSDRLDEITDGAGDGCVSFARTKLAGVSDHVVLHANHAELIRAPLLFRDPGPVACMPALLRWLKR